MSVEADKSFFNSENFHYTSAQSNCCLNRLRLVKEDLPAAYANRREIQLQKWEIAKSLEQVMKEKLKPVLEVHFSVLCSLPFPLYMYSLVACMTVVCLIFTKLIGSVFLSLRGFENLLCYYYNVDLFVGVSG